MSDSLPLDTANLAGLFCGAILYGVFVVLFVLCLHTLLYRRNTERANRILISGVVAMFVLNTVVLAISLSRCMDAFITLRDDTGGPLAYFEDLASWKEVARTAIILCYAVLADVILIYRCWVVWGRRLVIVAIPLLILVAGISMDILMVVTMASLSSGTVFFNVLKARITSALTIILFQNILVTSLIVYRIWRVDKTTVRAAVGNLQPIVRVVVESGVVFVATIFIFLMTYVTDSNSQYIMVDSINPMIGIAFSLLTIRVSQASPRSPNASTQSQTRSPQTPTVRSPTRFARAQQIVLPVLAMAKSASPKSQNRKSVADEERELDVVDIGRLGVNTGKGWSFWNDDTVV